MFPLFNNLYAPEDSGSGGGSEKETIELLNEEEVSEEKEVLDITPPKKSEEDEEEEEKPREKDELEEIEEELAGPKDEDLELVTPVRRKEILKKYPTLFKDFPYLEKAYYRDQQFTELMPTIQDAKVAREKSQVLDNIERDVMSGNITGILKAAKAEGDGEAFNKIADSYLGTLRTVDQDAYYHVLGNVIKDTIITMVREGNNLGEQQGAPLKAAANILNQFVFGSQRFTPPTTLSRQPQPDEVQRQKEQQDYDRQRVYSHFESVRSDLQTRADNVLRATIDQHIDPRSTMTDYVKGHATQEAFNTLEDLITKDTRFRGLLDRLWEKAFERGFDRESTDRIKSAYLSKAKTLLPSVIKKARNDALRGLGKRAEAEPEEVPERREVAAPKRPVGSGGRKASEIPKDMTSLDYLMKD